MEYKDLQLELLNHPFYQAWSRGDISTTMLSRYAESYLDFVSELPKLWNKVFTAFDLQAEGQSIIDEEIEHIALWNVWKDKLEKTENTTSLQQTIMTLHAMTPSELAGAIHAFEVQQPDVAESKKAGLIEHYGYTDAETVYFDEHMGAEEEKHIAFGKVLKSRANKAEFEAGFEKWAELYYKTLDQFTTKEQFAHC